MKIIIVAVQYIGSISGGGGVHVVELTRELGKLGHDVTVLSMGLGKHKLKEKLVLTDPHNPDKQRRRAVIQVIRFRPKDYQNLGSCFEGTKQQEIVRLLEFKHQALAYLYKQHTDCVIHLHGHFVVPSMAKELKERTKFKIVNSVHTFESLSERAKGKDGAPEKDIRTMEEMEEQAIQYSDHLIVRSEKVKEQISRLFPETVKKTRIAVLSSGVSSLFIHEPVYNEKRLKCVQEKYRIKGDLIYNLNRIDPSKGIEYLIKAYAMFYKSMQRSRKGYQASLVICGMIENKNKWYFKKCRDLISKIKEKEIKNSIAIYQNIEEADKIGLFHLARLFVLSSILEPFGITIVESLAKNVPVIASGVEGPRDIMGVKKVKAPFMKTDEGAIVYYDDKKKCADYLARALIYASNNYSEIIKKVKRAKIKNIKRYGWESLVQQKLKIYKKVCS